MFDYRGPAPLDSYDLYAMGLRPPRCNGCHYAELQWKLGDKFLRINKNGWVNVYELDAEPTKGQGEPFEYEGRPIKFRAGFMSIGHSDECWHFKAPSYPYVEPIPHIPGETWRTREGLVIPIKDIETNHLINILRYLERRKGLDGIRRALRRKNPTMMALRKEARSRIIDLYPCKPESVWDSIFPSLSESIVSKVTSWLKRRK